MRDIFTLMLALQKPLPPVPISKKPVVADPATFLTGGLKTAEKINEYQTDAR